MELVKDMGDILAGPPSDGAYEHFKASFLRRTTKSESSSLCQLLNVEELGLRRPTHILYRVRKLLFPGDWQHSLSLKTAFFESSSYGDSQQI